ncbi:hypothetical protein WICPIJ_010128 [Wickerhamomyces pijperi]|uniref:RRM domain-containing protein n=1 Tax=Wickerhamomyces pijperi TaxID=599730 RepID=A0A9P8PIX9_WICPI|nr:hypothetical protein WICPIJ_010128 [Wickerhamomyces pijperi]
MSYNYNYQPASSSYRPNQQQSNQYSHPSSRASQLWMGELDPYWDENVIKQIWTSFGFQLTNVKLIKERYQQNQNAGYAFVEFATVAEATKAVALNGTAIYNTNRFLRLNWSGGNHSSGPSSNGAGNYGHRSEFSIFVGDLALETTEAVLFEFFGSKYSSLSSVKIMNDNATGQSKGYGFVRFSAEADQQRSLAEMQGAILNGRPIRVSTAAPKGKQYAAHQQFQPQQLPHHTQQQQQPFITPNYSRPQPLDPQQQILNTLDTQYQPPLDQFTDPNNTTVFIGGLPSIVTEEDLKYYFQAFGDITYVKIPLGKGCGFVQFTTRNSAEVAIAKMQGYPIGNSRIRLSWGKANSGKATTTSSSSSASSINAQPGAYIQQQELPLMYGMLPTQQANVLNLNLNSTAGQAGSSVPSFNAEISEPNFQVSGSLDVTAQTTGSSASASGAADDQSRLNQLYLAARDGRLDTIETAANGFY